ncbi:DUF317 domain-containing protein [Catenulispora rubra]|uniref:DUF317 domain-containing protein n=1 Tax=Catenulispora rubra TaxID=280293 RepID=UPI00189209B0|nr:DUF317 domain-containing protein [Catenulispora rubra]
MHEYAFDIQLNTTARTCADTEAQAREHLKALDWEFGIDYRVGEAGEEVWLTEASMADYAAKAPLVEPRPEPEPASPLYRAGCNGYDAVLDLTQAPGWTRYTDASGDNHTDVSPDRQLSVEFGPEADAPYIAPLWRITYRDPDPYHPQNSFAAHFDGRVPAEAIAAFLAALTSASPRPDDDAEARTVPAATPGADS